MTKEEKIKRYLIWTRIKRACCYRAVSLIVTSAIAWGVLDAVDFQSSTSNPIIGLSIGTLDLIIKLFLYYGHETLWEKKMTEDIRKIKIKYDLL